MQLDLFADNRSNILLNIADEYLRAKEFAKALSTCEQVREEYPDNRQAPGLCRLIHAWCDRIAEIAPAACKPQQLKDLLDSFPNAHHPALRTAILETVLDLLQSLPEPDHIFLPPRFHRGHLLLELGRSDDAEAAFRAALTSSQIERGRFLGWHADAMTLAGNAEDAVSVYMQAFIEDPASVDISGIKHPAIQQLHQHCAQYADGIDDDGVAVWLPVWGWLQGVFSLPLRSPPRFDDLVAQVDVTAVPRIWFDLLICAEYLRTVQRDDRQMAEVRRLMKRLSEEMFDCYMQKNRGTRP
jgi:tetratricopeptide (TPR) repeat protein